MAKQAATADAAMRAGVYDVECAHGTARVHVTRDRSARDVACAFRALSTAPEGEAIANAA